MTEAKFWLFYVSLFSTRLNYIGFFFNLITLTVLTGVNYVDIVCSSNFDVCGQNLMM